MTGAIRPTFITHDYKSLPPPKSIAKRQPSRTRLPLSSERRYPFRMKGDATRRLIAVLLAAVLLAPLLVHAAGNDSVCVITIHEEITQNTLYLVRRGLREATEKHAAAVILDMNTNGGRVDAMEEIIQLLEHAPMKTCTFVEQKAYSAGAFIAAATDEIYMAPGSVIGAATPIMVGPGEGVQSLPQRYEEKLNSAMRALIRATATQKGHNPDVFEAMVDSDRELVIDGKTINPKGKLLTLTDSEALRAYGKPPKPLLSAGTTANLQEVLEKTGLHDATIVQVSPYGFELAARGITAISPLLILIGFLALYVELSHPGMAVPALVAVICFGVYFLGYFLAGLAGWEVAALFAVGLALLAFEVLVPGHLVSGFVGICLIMISLVLAMTQRWPGGPLLPEWAQLQVPLAKLVGGVAGSIVGAIILGRYLPKSTLFKKMELSAATSAGDGYASAPAGAIIGATGVAETNLRPSGKARIGEQLVDVVTQGDLIEKGASVKIILVEGSRVVVARPH